MDMAGIIRLLLNGASGATHYGDGQFFYSPQPKISEGRSVTMDAAGNIVVCESDYGYVRRIRFLTPESLGASDLTRILVKWPMARWPIVKKEPPKLKFEV
jgi:hypothetical protein